jgi:hypothetical protein
LEKKSGGGLIDGFQFQTAPDFKFKNAEKP